MAIAWPWPRWPEYTASSSRSWRAHRSGDALLPPMLRWTSPWTSPARVEPPTRSSNSRIRHIVASRRSACSPPSGGVPLTPSTGADPSTCCTAVTILSSFGITQASSGSLYGIVASSAVTCTIGAFSDENPCSATSPAITVETDACRVAWSTSTSRPGLVDRLEDRLRVERRERARVDHLRLDPLRGQLLGCTERAIDRPARGDDRHVAALAPDRGLAEGNEVLAVGHLSVLEREQIVVQVDDGVVVADRGRHQPLGVGGGRRHHDLEAGNAHEERADRAGVLAGPAGGEAEARLEHERHLHLAAAHRAEAGRLVDHLVHRDEHELGHVELDHGPEAGERGADRHADLGRLGDRRDADAVLAERVDVRLVLGRRHVLAEVEDGVVALHLEPDRLVDGGDEGQFMCHESIASF